MMRGSLSPNLYIYTGRHKEDEEGPDVERREGDK